MSSTEIVRIGQGSEFGKLAKFPETIEELPGYFAGANLADGNRFRNFKQTADILVNELDRMAGLSRSNETETQFIPFNPVKSKFDPETAGFLDVMEDQDSFKLHDSDKQVESQALVDMTYHLTQAEELFDTRQKGTGYVVMHGSHDDSHVYFIENYLADVKGGYMIWSVASGIPEAVLCAEQAWHAEKEKEIFRKLVEEGLKDLPVIELEQAA
jgi:hypothetical protein